MIDPPKTAAKRPAARTKEMETDARDVAAAVREPLPPSIPTPVPAPDAAPPVRAAAPGAAPRGPSTGFFRDPAAFRALAELVPSLFADKGPDQAVRVWVAGCATGEEAWSIAVLLAEHAATLPHSPPWQLFATDTDAAACGRGRTALYLASATAGIPTERLNRFFKWEGGGYRVGKPLRDAVTFAVHDVLRDPPIEGLDLAVCRGLLGRLPAEARTRLLATLHGALRPGGVLFLGAADAAGEGFVPDAQGHGIHRRGGADGAARLAAGGEILTHDGSRA